MKALRMMMNKEAARVARGVPAAPPKVLRRKPYNNGRLRVQTKENGQLRLTSRP